jgi:anti-anti-sigma factor
MASQDRSPRSRIAGPPIDLQISYRLGPPLIYVKGELDHDTTGYLREMIDQELKGSTQVLILDFSELAYMDSGGLSLMFDAVQRFTDPGWLGVVGANSGVGRLLEITGLVDHPRFFLFADQRAAAAAIDAGGST